uniref:hypothetical protein n=1 Tax=Neisseria sicca TaxID=490 RepID=UPI0011BD1119
MEEYENGGKVGRLEKGLSGGVKMVIGLVEGVGYGDWVKEVGLEVGREVCIRGEKSEVRVEGMMYFEVR